MIALQTIGWMPQGSVSTKKQGIFFVVVEKIMRCKKINEGENKCRKANSKSQKLFRKINNNYHSKRRTRVAYDVVL